MARLINIYNKKVLKSHLTDELKSDYVEVGRISEHEIYIMTRYSGFIVPQYVYNEFFGKILKANMPEIGDIKYFNKSGEYKGTDTIYQLKDRLDSMLEKMTIPLYKTNYIKKQGGEEFYICSAEDSPVLVNRQYVDMVEGNFDGMYINEKHFSLYIECVGTKTILLPIRATETPIEKFIAKEFKNE